MLLNSCVYLPRRSKVLLVVMFGE